MTPTRRVRVDHNRASANGSRTARDVQMTLAVLPNSGRGCHPRTANSTQWATVPYSNPALSNTRIPIATDRARDFSWYHRPGPVFRRP